MKPTARVEKGGDAVPQVRPPKDAQPLPLPDAWPPAMRCILKEARALPLCFRPLLPCRLAVC